MRGKAAADVLEDRILNAARIMVNILAEALLREGGEQITVPQFRILDMVANLTGKPAEIARMLSVSPPAVTFLLERLEAKGLLRREPLTSDRRRVEVALTEEGADLVRRVNTRRRRLLQSILRRMDDPARDRLASSLAEFNRAYLYMKEEGG
ncbi:MAG: MarR family transcriptional regulator [Actinobacteria bacterium]|nr:MarR family transcriptional regulator [Actinomycetota bacterium]